MYLGILAALAGLAAATGGPDDVMQSRFGNTSFTLDSSGRTSSMYYEADHTFSGKLAGGDAVSGTWEVKGGALCLTWGEPPAGYRNPTCSPVTSRKLGETWTAGPYTVTLLPGRQ